MVEYRKIGLLLATVWLSNIAFARKNNECGRHQSLVSGDEFVFKCTSAGYITNAKVENNQRQCSFRNNNYVMREESKNCNVGLMNRVSLQQQCPNDSNCPHNNYTFIVKNIQSKGKEK